MKTKELFNKVKGDVGSILSKVAGKAEIIAKISKEKLDITRFKSKIHSHYKEIGEYVYNNKNDFSENTYIKDICKKIDELENKIEDKNKEIEILKTLEQKKKKEEKEEGKEKKTE